AEGPIAERMKERLDGEIKVLTDAGAKVEVVYPDAGSVAAFGVNLMDARRRPAAAKAGYAQGKAEADALKAFWTGCARRSAPARKTAKLGRCRATRTAS